MMWVLTQRCTFLMMLVLPQLIKKWTGWGWREREGERERE